ncbi:MAG: hypothetical protein JXR97_05440 [Planctomycetes bacterium]|nr:hypothetical protein [Planctomycetota bacterium]
MKDTWEKVLEYASSPLHGTMSRKLRKGVKLQVNGGQIFENAQIFIGDFVRFTMIDGEASINSYYDLEKIISITTISTPQN